MTIEAKVKYIKGFLICLQVSGYLLILLNIFFIFKSEITLNIFLICCMVLLFSLLLIKIGKETEIRYTDDSLEVVYNAKD